MLLALVLTDSHDAKSGAPLVPGAQLQRIDSPGHLIETRCAGLIGRWRVQHQALRSELAPERFGAESVVLHGIGSKPGSLADLQRGRQHLARRRADTATVARSRPG